MDRALELLAIVATSYFAAPLGLLSGNITLTALLPALGMLLGLVGLVLAVARGERRAPMLALPLLLALCLPAVIFFFNLMLRRVGIWFGIASGLLALLLWIAIIAGDTRNRLPAWLIGGFILSYGVHTALVMLALDGG